MRAGEAGSPGGGLRRALGRMARRLGSGRVGRQAEGGGGAPAAMRPSVRALALRTPGFLEAAEGDALFSLAAEASLHAPCLEVGSYCGRSSLFLAEGCRAAGTHPLICVDHHRGSPEQQEGQEYFDTRLFDRELGSVYTLDRFVRTVERAGLTGWAIPLVATSETARRCCAGLELGLVFVDGGHDEATVRDDVEGWRGRVRRGGYLCIHDLFPDPADGGQAPWRLFQETLGAPGWSVVRRVGTLGVLRRT